MAKKPNIYPNESFVVNSVVRYLQSEGFDDIIVEVEDEDIKQRNLSQFLYRVDILAFKDDEEWRIECKGDAGNPSTDFDTLLGDILRRMDDARPHYAVAMPDIKGYETKSTKLPKLIRAKLKLRYIWVEKDGTVRIDEP